MANTIFVPQLIEAGIEAKLGDMIALYSISDVKDLGNKVGGEKITVPTTKYIGDATKVAPGVTIPTSDFKQGTEEVEVHKYAKAVEFTEEEVINAYSDVEQDAEDQLLASLANGIEKDLFEALEGISVEMTHNATGALNKVVVSGALAKFGEDLKGEKYLIVNPLDLAELRNDTTYTDVTNGVADAVGQIYGCYVVPSNRVKAANAFIIKPKATAIYLKKKPLVEADKDISNQTHFVAGTTHAGLHLKDKSKAIKIVLGE